jgi:hypothetical protein
MSTTKVEGVLSGSCNEQSQWCLGLQCPRPC